MRYKKPIFDRYYNRKVEKCGEEKEDMKCRTIKKGWGRKKMIKEMEKLKEEMKER